MSSTTSQKISVILGSDSDLNTMKKCTDVLAEFGVVHELKILSAHRSPAALHEYVGSLKKNGFALVISAAGMANHLSGSIAALTTLPVIGCPMEGSTLGGLDALLSTVQMPGGIPVATMSIGGAGAKNAALFAVAVLSLQNAELAAKLEKYKKDQAEATVAKNNKIGK